MSSDTRRRLPCWVIQYTSRRPSATATALGSSSSSSASMIGSHLPPLHAAPRQLRPQAPQLFGSSPRSASQAASSTLLSSPMKTRQPPPGRPPGRGPGSSAVGGSPRASRAQAGAAGCGPRLQRRPRTRLLRRARRSRRDQEVDGRGGRRQSHPDGHVGDGGGAAGVLPEPVAVRRALLGAAVNRALVVARDGEGAVSTIPPRAAPAPRRR